MAKAMTAPMPLFAVQRYGRFAGVLCFLIAGFLLLSLITYHSGDPSMNRATSEPVKNLGGPFGATLSDIILQTFGLGSFLVSALLFAWGWRLVTGDVLRLFWLRVAFFCLALMTFSTALAAIKPYTFWPIASGFGGAMGLLLYEKATMILPAFLMVPICFGLSIALLTLSMALSRHEWRYIGGFFLIISAYATVVAGLIRDAFRGEASKPAKKKPRAKQIALTQDDDEEDEFQYEEEDEDDAPAIKVKQAVSRKSKPQKKQASFELRPKQGDYELPAYTLLKSGEKSKKTQVSDASLQQNAKMLGAVLQDFGINGEMAGIKPGPVVTLYELEPSPGTKSSRVIGLADDIARSMSAISARIAVIPGKNGIGIELPNRTRETVFLRDLLEDETFSDSKCALPLALGRDIGGDPIVVDLARMPHLLVAGTTGSGKSVAINTMIMSLAYHLTPSQCRFIMVDPKMLELSVYDGIPHLLSPVVTEPGKAVVALKWAVREMENRYRLMSTLGVRNIDSYNKRLKEAKRTGEVLKRQVQTGFDPETGKPIFEDQEMDTEPLPFIVIIVDEMADLMLTAGKEIEGSIQRLAQMARAAGIHLIMATQRPSVDVITGVIKANFPTRISFQVTSKIDSRTILGEQGAEQLLGQGDMLYMAGGGRITRIHGPFIGDAEVEDVVKHLKSQGEPEYIEAVTYDDEEAADEFGEEEETEEDKQLYDRAVQIVLRDRKASTSYIQRHLKIGYNRAARIIEKMEKEGLVGAANHIGKREVLAR